MWEEVQREKPPPPPPPRKPNCRLVMGPVYKRWQQKRLEDLKAGDDREQDEAECIRQAVQLFAQVHNPGNYPVNDANRAKAILVMIMRSRDPSVLPVRRVLRPWQVVAANRLVTRGSSNWQTTDLDDEDVPKQPSFNASLLAVHDVGLGKTITAILSLASVYRLNPDPVKHKTLIVVPKTMLSSWYQHLKGWTTLGVRVFKLQEQGELKRIQTSPEERYVLKQFKEAHVVLTTPDVLVAAFKTFKRDTLAGVKPRTLPLSECIADKLEDPAPKPHLLFQILDSLALTVIDEIHAYAGPNTWWGIVLRIFARRSFYKLGLTGTPVQNKPEEIAHLAKVLNVVVPRYMDPEQYVIREAGKKNKMNKKNVTDFQEDYVDRVDVTFAEAELPERKFVVLKYDPFVGLLPNGEVDQEAISRHNEAVVGLRARLADTKDSPLSFEDTLEELDDDDSLADTSGEADPNASLSAQQKRERKIRDEAKGKLQKFIRCIEQSEFSASLAEHGAAKFTSKKDPAKVRALLDDAADKRPSQVMMLIARVIQDRQAAGHPRIAVFSESKAVLLILQRFLEDKDVGEMFYFTGDVTDPDKRAQMVKDFRACAKGVFLFTEAGGVGITLSPNQTETGSDVLLSVGPLPWKSTVVDQAFGRVYRLRAPYPVEIIQFVAHRSLTYLKMLVHDDKRDRLGKATMDQDYSNFERADDGTWKRETKPLSSIVPLDIGSGNYKPLHRQVAALRAYQLEKEKFDRQERDTEPKEPADWPRAPVLPSRMRLRPVSFVRSADDPEKWIAAGPGLSAKAQGKRPMSAAQMEEEELEQVTQTSKLEAEAMEEDQVADAMQASMQALHAQDRRDAANQE